MGPSLLRNVIQVCLQATRKSLPQGLPVSPSGVSVNPLGARVKMPHGGPAGWRSVEVGLRSVSGRLSSQLPASSATTVSRTWEFAEFRRRAPGVPDHFGRPRVPPSVACRGGLRERPGGRAGDVTPASGAPPAPALPDGSRRLVGVRRGSGGGRWSVPAAVGRRGCGRALRRVWRGFGGGCLGGRAGCGSVGGRPGTLNAIGRGRSGPCGGCGRGGLRVADWSPSCRRRAR
jgi:hypothetical protein